MDGRRTKAPEWRSGHDGKRVLIEGDDEIQAWRFQRLAELNGWNALVCPGPGGCTQGCPLLAEGACGAADGADVVVYALDLNDIPNRSVLWGHRPFKSIRPVIVASDARTAATFENVLDGLDVFRGPVRGTELVQSLSKAASRPHAVPG